MERLEINLMCLGNYSKIVICNTLPVICGAVTHYFGESSWLDLGSVSQSRFSENSESINPEMRETLNFPFHKSR